MRVCANTVQYRVVRRKKKIREIGLFTVQDAIKKSLRGALFQSAPHCFYPSSRGKPLWTAMDSYEPLITVLASLTFNAIMMASVRAGPYQTIAEKAVCASFGASALAECKRTFIPRASSLRLHTCLGQRPQKGVWHLLSGSCRHAAGKYRRIVYSHYICGGQPMIFRKKLVIWRHDGHRISSTKAKALIAQGIPVEKITTYTKKWYVRLRLPNGRVQDYPGYENKSATKLYEAQLLKRIASNEPISAVQVRTVGEAVDLYFKSRPHLAPRSIVTYRYVFGMLDRNLPLSKLTPQEVLRIFQNRNLSPVTQRRNLTVFSCLANFLVKNGVLTSNPFKDVLPDFKLTPRYRKAPLTLDELEWLIEVTSQGPIRAGLPGPVRAALYLLCATSGLRRSEVFLLQQADVDLEKGIVVVPASLSKNRKQASIPLPERTVSLLKKIVLLPEAESSQPYFPWKTSTRNSSSGIYKSFLKDLEAAGIAREKPQGRICFHSLRLTYAYFLAVKGGLPIVVAQRLMRHSTPQLTSNIYINLGLNELTDAVQNAFADFNHQHPDPFQTSGPPLSSQTDQTPDHLSSRSI